MQLIDIDIWQLLDLADKKKVICFGAGKKLKNFIRDYESFHILEKIYCVLDNDERKNNTQLSFSENSFANSLKVYSFGEFLNMNIDSCIILITSSYVCEIVEQLEQCRQLKDVQCCYSRFVRALTNEKEESRRSYPESFRIYDTQRIPKRIHYCWFGGNKIPEQNLIWMQSWKKYCPDYEFIEWNETNYDITKNEYMHEAYMAKKWGFVSDYARLDVVYHYGGIYLDTDVELIRNLDELLYQDAFAGIEADRVINTGLGFGAVARYHIIKELLDFYDKIHFDSKNMVACTELNERIFEKHGYIKNGNFQSLDGMTIYPEKVLSGKNMFNRVINPTEHTFAIHHYDASWDSEERKNAREKLKLLYQRFIKI